jgi:hypothetical protein
LSYTFTCGAGGYGMSWAFLFTTLLVSQQPDSFPSLDRDLVAEIKGWKNGDPPPRKLLRFPDGPPALPPLSGMSVFGSGVGDYVSRINDQELLKSLLFDTKADPACVQAAASRLIDLRGVKAVKSILADWRKKNPADFVSTELATLSQLLASQYLRVQVASLEKKDVPKEVADKALTSLKGDLAAGVPWDRAYRKAADSLFDKEASQKQGGGWRTFLCYRYKGVISETGFNVLDRRISDKLHPDHVRKLFEAKGGILQFETADMYWLYYIEAFYE